MIIQLLGVALISLLTITPTIQQNNIEQFIAPNIEIQPMLMNSSDPNRLVVINQFSHYDSIGSFQSAKLYTNFTDIIWGGSIYTYDTGNNSATYITDNDLYTYNQSVDMTGNEYKNLLREYYFRTRGGYPTSETFSFTQTTMALSSNSTYYTYTLNGSQGLVNGRIYITPISNVNDNTITNINRNVSVIQNSTLLSLIQNLNIQISFENQSTFNTKILYYFLNSALPLNTMGTYSRILYARTNYGGTIDLGNINVTITEPDVISPTITGITGNTTNWTNQNITLIIQATDNVGLNSTAYSFDNGITYQASNQATFTTNQIVNVRVRDSSNNSVLEEVTINRIDKQPPSILLAGNWKNTFQLGELANNQALLSYLSISDGASGLNNGLTTISNFNYNQAGSYSNIQVSATDNAGNTDVYTLPTVSITEQLDNTGPIITGPTTVNVEEGNITTQAILDLYSISDTSGVEPNTISIRDLNNNVITNWAPYTVGSYQLRVYARDTLNNVTQYQFTLQVGEAPPPDLTPPTIVGPLLVSFEIGTYTSNTEILNLYTFTDNVAILQNQLIGEVDYSELGDYQVTIRSTDTSNNITNRNIVVRIRDEVILGNYNPLTDLLSGIFGGLLSMIFTIGTINVLGLRLLDAMGVIILGAVLLFVYKAIKGGS